MKKSMIGLVGLTIAISMMAPIYAATETEEVTTSINYDKVTEYTLSIPESIQVDNMNELEQAIGVSKVNTRHNEKVQISVKSGVDAGGKVTLTRKGGSSTVTTEITVSLTSKGSGIGANEIIAEFEDQSSTATKGGTLFFSPIPKNALAGEYEGKITFVASVVERT